MRKFHRNFPSDAQVFTLFVNGALSDFSQFFSLRSEAVVGGRTAEKEKKKIVWNCKKSVSFKRERNQTHSITCRPWCGSDILRNRSRKAPVYALSYRYRSYCILIRFDSSRPFGHRSRLSWDLAVHFQQTEKIRWHANNNNNYLNSYRCNWADRAIGDDVDDVHHMFEAAAGQSWNSPKVTTIASSWSSDFDMLMTWNHSFLLVSMFSLAMEFYYCHKSYHRQLNLPIFYSRIKFSVIVCVFFSGGWKKRYISGKREKRKTYFLQ